MSTQHPTRILYVHANDELYGSDVVLLQLLSRIDRTRFEPIVIVPCDVDYPGALRRELDAINVRYYRLRMGVIRRRYFTLPGAFQYAAYLSVGAYKIAQIARAERVALIHSNTSAVFGGAIAARRLKLPHIWHVHEIINRPAAVGRMIAAYVRNNADVIVAISQAVADYVAPNGHPALQTIWDGVDTTIFNPAVDGRRLRAEWGLGPAEIAAGIVGRISHWKGQEVFLTAVAQAMRRMPNLRPVIVGDPVPGDTERLPALQNLAEELAIADRIVWVPFTDRVPEVMRAIDLLVHPPTQPEPLGLVVLEAMASARPVIASAHGGPLETVADGETGLLVTPGDSAALADAIVSLSGDSDRRNTMGAAGRQRACRQFSLDRFLSEWTDLYTRLL